MQILVGDTIYFSTTDGSTGDELWAHDTSNGSTWRVADIHTGTLGSEPGMYMRAYLLARPSISMLLLWAARNCGHMTSLTTPHGAWWISTPVQSAATRATGWRCSLAIRYYFDANDGSTGDELWAHDTSNHSTWQVLISEAVRSAVAPEVGWKSSSEIRCISPQMMETLVTNCGRTTLLTIPHGVWPTSRSGFSGEWPRTIHGPPHRRHPLFLCR